MTQKLLESEKSVEDLLQAIEPKGIADQSMRRTISMTSRLLYFHFIYAYLLTISLS